MQGLPAVRAKNCCCPGAVNVLLLNFQLFTGSYSSTNVTVQRAAPLAAASLDEVPVIPFPHRYKEDVEVVENLHYIVAIISLTDGTNCTGIGFYRFRFTLNTKNPNEEHSYPPCLITQHPNPVQSPTSAVCASALADRDGSLRAGFSACVVHDCLL